MHALERAQSERRRVVAPALGHGVDGDDAPASLGPLDRLLQALVALQLRPRVVDEVARHEEEHVGAALDRLLDVLELVADPLKLRAIDDAHAHVAIVLQLDVLL